MAYQKITTLTAYAKGIVHFLKVGKYTTTKNQNYQYVSFSLKVAVPGNYVYLRFFVSSKQTELWKKCEQLTDGKCLTCEFGISQQTVVRPNSEQKEYYPVLLLRDFVESDRKYQLCVNVYEYDEVSNRTEQ